MHWYTALCKAADDFEGGARSFPLADEAGMATKYAYEPPNPEYEKLFFRRAVAPRSQRDPKARPQSAGWLIPHPTDNNLCKPVFVAHSIVSAIWLLHATFDEYDAADSLPNGTWEALVGAAESLSQPFNEKSPTPEPPASRTTAKKRAALAADAPDDPPSKRTRNSPPPISLPGSGERVVVQRPPKITPGRRRIKLGLLAPGPAAIAKEKKAYNLMAEEDEDAIAWILKQPMSIKGSNTKDGGTFFTETSTPYDLACAMLEKARQLGGHSARLSAAKFLQDWREHNTLFPADIRSSQAMSLSHDRLLQLGTNSIDRTFCFAWSMHARYQTDMEGVTIRSRWSCALLGEAYAKKKEQIREDDARRSNDTTRNRYGKGQVATQAAKDLMDLVYAEPSLEQKRRFHEYLQNGTRWYKIVTALGWGSLLLMPHEQISNFWIQTKLREGQLQIFLQLVQREKPELCAATKALDEWLGPDAIAGGSIATRERLRIESEAPALLHRLKEIPDSDNDDGDSIPDVMYDSDNSVQVLSTPMRASSEDDVEDALQTEVGLLDLFRVSEL